MSISNYAEGKFLEYMKEKQPFYVKLHIGDPGEAGTSNAAAETKRKKLEFNAPSSGAMSSSLEQLWEELAETEKVSHISLWDASTEGNCWWTGSLDEAKDLVKGEGFRFKAGEVIVALD